MLSAYLLTYLPPIHARTSHLFIACISISEVYLMREADGVTSRGSAFVIFDSAVSAGQASMALHNAVPPGE